MPERHEVIEALRKTLRANEMQDGVHVRLTITRGIKYTSGLDPRINVRGCTITEKVVGTSLCEQVQPPPVSVNTAAAGLRRGRGRYRDYKSTEQLVRDTLRLVGMLPRLSGVCGVPRSGLLPASILATHLHLPLFQWNGLRPEQLGNGYRSADLIGRSSSDPMLIVDDSIASGGQMGRIKSKLGSDNYLYASVYSSPPHRRPSLEDFPAVVIPSYHLFEWNIHNSYMMPRFAYDFDGILCRDFTAEEVADEERYAKTIESIEPLANIPRQSPISMIVTARPEIYRPQTERWLARYGIRVKKLIMFPASSNAERDRLYNPGQFKGVPYRNSKLQLFIESCPEQAKAIAKVSGKPVLCPGTGDIF